MPVSFYSSNRVVNSAVNGVHALNKKCYVALMVSAIGGIAMPAYANSLLFDTDYLDYQLPADVSTVCEVKNNCPDISVEYMHSNHAWMNDIINEHINRLILATPNDMTQATQTKPQSDPSIKNTLDDFAKSQLVELPSDSSLNYSIDVSPSYVGHIDDIEIFNINSYLYLGGAHGMPYSEYVMLDQHSQKQVILDDLIPADKKTQFNALAYAAYKQWIAQMSEAPEDYESSWPFNLSDNIVLTDKGLDIVYQPYAIAPFAYGMPVLSMTYEQLNGVINPRYVPKQ